MRRCSPIWGLSSQARGATANRPRLAGVHPSLSPPAKQMAKTPRARCRLEPNGEPSVRAKTLPGATRSKDAAAPRRSRRSLSRARPEASRALRRRRTGRPAAGEQRAARPARLAPKRARPRARSWRASILRRREARRALKRILRLRDRQRGAAGLLLVGVRQSGGVLRIENIEVGTDPQLRGHLSGRSQQAGVRPVQFRRG